MRMPKGFHKLGYSISFIQRPRIHNNRRFLGFRARRLRRRREETLVRQPLHNDIRLLRRNSVLHFFCQIDVSVKLGLNFLDRAIVELGGDSLQSAFRRIHMFRQVRNKRYGFEMVFLSKANDILCNRLIDGVEYDADVLRFFLFLEPSFEHFLR